MAENLAPETRARVLIDEQLTQAGWVVQDRKDLDLVNHVGVAVRGCAFGTPSLTSAKIRNIQLLVGDRQGEPSSRKSEAGSK